MAKFIDITGQTFGQLTAVKIAGRDKHKIILWVCKCNICGKETIVLGNYLRRGNAKSCGCLKKELISKANTVHGLSRTREFRIWAGIRSRCNDTNSSIYKYYGERGIKICEKWDNFESFLADMGKCPEPGYSIERLNNDGPYSPENCIWADRKTQARNRTNSRKVTYRGQILTLAEWSEILNMRYSVLHCRLQRNWSDERTLTQPVVSNPRLKRNRTNIKT